MRTSSNSNYWIKIYYVTITLCSFTAYNIDEIRYIFIFNKSTQNYHCLLKWKNHTLSNSAYCCNLNRIQSFFYVVCHIVARHVYSKEVDQTAIYFLWSMKWHCACIVLRTCILPTNRRCIVPWIQMYYNTMNKEQ